MIYRHLYLDVVIRVILLTVSCFGFAFEYVLINDVIINLNLLALIAIQVVLFIRSSNRINRDLQTFFMSVRNEDSTLRFSRRFRTRSFNRLHQTLQEVNDLIRRIKLENIEQNQYFKTITEHITVGLISFNRQGEVKLLNQAAKDLFNVKGAVSLASLDRRKKGLSEEIVNMKPSEKKLIKLKIEGIHGAELKQLAVRATELKLRDEQVKIVSFQDIKNELEEKELEAWQNLIRVLTHEMMNSTGPIKSTTHTLIELITSNKMADGTQRNASDELMNDLLDGLQIIKERSTGLEKFVKHFRQLNLLPQPEFQEVRLKEVLRNMGILMDEDIRKNNIAFRIKTQPQDLSVEADKKMLEQLLINLVKNSIHSLRKTKNPTLEVSAYSLGDGRVEISVKDNGTGIQPEEIEKIFIPFYTTHEEGSGIGLSLARQIMRMHRGTIEAFSEPGIQTVFTLRF